MSVAISARANCTAWNSAMGLPNWRRSCGVTGGMAPGAGGQAEHLRADADAAFVQGLDGDFVALAGFAEHVVRGHAAVVEDQLAGAGGADSELVLLVADGESGRVFLDEECGDSLIAGGGVEGGEDDEEAGLGGVRDPKFAAVEEVVCRRRIARGSSERMRRSPSRLR